MRRLLAATDLSPRSDRAARRAADLARSLGAELLLLYVVDDDQPASLAEAERREALALLHGRASELAARRTTPRRGSWSRLATPSRGSSAPPRPGGRTSTRAPPTRSARPRRSACSTART